MKKKSMDLQHNCAGVLSPVVFFVSLCLVLRGVSWFCDFVGVRGWLIVVRASVHRRLWHCESDIITKSLTTAVAGSTLSIPLLSKTTSFHKKFKRIPSFPLVINIIIFIKISKFSKFYTLLQTLKTFSIFHHLKNIISSFKVVGIVNF